MQQRGPEAATSGLRKLSLSGDINQRANDL